MQPKIKHGSIRKLELSNLLHWSRKTTTSGK